MKLEIAHEWLIALRSGEYKQGRTFLNKHVSSEYCCLGVLCELAVKEGIVEKIVEDGIGLYGKEKAYSSLPDEVLRWAGLCSSYGAIPSLKSSTGSLVRCNDSFRYTFKQIADLIEQHCKEL